MTNEKIEKITIAKSATMQSSPHMVIMVVPPVDQEIVHVGVGEVVRNVAVVSEGPPAVTWYHIGTARGLGQEEDDPSEEMQVSR